MVNIQSKQVPKQSEAKIPWLTVRKTISTASNLQFSDKFSGTKRYGLSWRSHEQLGIFEQQWQDYEVATGLDQKGQSVRLATFRSVMEKECLQIFLNLNFGTEELTISSALKALETYFLPKRNVVYERYVLNSCIQSSEETIDCYGNRLRKLASSCQFGTLTDEMIHDRLVIGIQDKSTKARLFREKDLSLDKALDVCQVK